MTTQTHTVAILVLDTFVPFDLSIPYNMFRWTKLADGTAPYNVCFCGTGQSITHQEFTITPQYGLDRLSTVDTIVIPGIDDALLFNNTAVIHALQVAAANKVRLASICTGAGVLAAAGLLEGLRATTHWSVADDFARKFPLVHVEPEILYVDNGQIMTSAGLASGIDLCLHIIRKDYGSAVAESIARFFVVPIEREGRQLQIVQHKAPQTDTNLNQLLLWLTENLHLEHSLQSIAEYAGMGQRTIHRKFKEQLSIAPMTWIMASRIRRAQALLESTTLSIEEITTATGFNSATVFRDRFRQNVGTSPTAWRKTYENSAQKKN